jgi:hypothetical protein
MWLSPQTILRLDLEGALPLFTLLPRRGLLGNLLAGCCINNHDRPVFALIVRFGGVGRDKIL